MKTRDIKDRKIGVIGFNARPIACSVKKAGAKAFVSDYWGDDDLAECSEEWVAVLTPEPNKRQRGSLDAPVYESLSKNMIDIFKDYDLDAILVGSGFDDHADFLEPIDRQWGLAGNSVELMKTSRDLSSLKELCKDHEICLPTSFDIETIEEGMIAGNNLGYPLVLRRTSSGGGSGIHLMRNETELENILNIRIELGHVVRLQKYIPGRDVSCSVLSTGIRAETLSIQGQLIGMPSAGRLSDFAYCGNYMPLSITHHAQEKISHFSESVCTKIGLLGSNGLDFVIDENDTVYLMEINPRLQGTLEMLEISGSISVIEHHFNALKGVLPETQYNYKPVVKMIVYALKTGNVPDLSIFPNTYDRTPQDVKVFQGDPVCTIIESNSSLIECYTNAIQTASQIQKGIYDSG